MLWLLLGLGAGALACYMGPNDRLTYYEIDPVNVDTWAQVKAFYAKLRG